MFVFILKEVRPENQPKGVFFVRHKDKRKHNQRFLYIKINLLVSNFLLSSLEMKRRFVQTKVYYKFFYSVLKETTHKPLKVTTAQKMFVQCVC